MQWEYAPADTNLCYGRNYTDTEASYVTAGFGNTFLKAQYVGYTDGTFSNKTVRAVIASVPSSAPRSPAQRGSRASRLSRCHAAALRQLTTCRAASLTSSAITCTLGLWAAKQDAQTLPNRHDKAAILCSAIMRFRSCIFDGSSAVRAGEAGV